MKCYFDRLKEVGKPKLEMMIAQQKAKIAICERDLKLMYRALEDVKSNAKSETLRERSETE